MRNRVPALVKHCTVAIFKKGNVRGGTQTDKFLAAWKIARAQLTKFGLLAEGSQVGPASTIRLTPKGKAREAVHRREPGGAARSLLFDKMYVLIENAELGNVDKDQDTK